MPFFESYVLRTPIFSVDLFKEVLENYSFKKLLHEYSNNKVFQTYGGPRIGRMAYFSILYDFTKKI